MGFSDAPAAVPAASVSDAPRVSQAGVDLTKYTQRHRQRETETQTQTTHTQTRRHTHIMNI
jgi:hypothetical protein